MGISVEYFFENSGIIDDNFKQGTKVGG